MVADVRIQISNQTDGVENVAFADFAVDRNAFDAFVGQVDRGVAQEGNGFKHTLGDDRLHNVQLQLTCFGCESDGGVVADDFEADLVDQAASKARRQLSRRHEGKALILKIKESLYRKGFDLDLVNQWLDAQDWEEPI